MVYKPSLPRLLSCPNCYRNILIGGVFLNRYSDFGVVGCRFRLPGRRQGQRAETVYGRQAQDQGKYYEGDQARPGSEEGPDEGEAVIGSFFVSPSSFSLSVFLFVSVIERGRERRWVGGYVYIEYPPALICRPKKWIPLRSLLLLLLYSRTLSRIKRCTRQKGFKPRAKIWFLHIYCGSLTLYEFAKNAMRTTRPGRQDTSVVEKGRRCSKDTGNRQGKRKAVE
jgi:hypothetical protein